MSLEKKIRAIQESTSGGHMDNQELVMLRQKVEQIRAYKRPDLEDEVYAGGMALDAVNSRITFPDHSNNAVLSPSMSIHAELENKWQEALVTRFLGNILRKNLFAHPLSELGPMDSARFDSIRGACVFCFEVAPSGTHICPALASGMTQLLGASVITYMSRGAFDIYGITPEQVRPLFSASWSDISLVPQAMTPDGAMLIIGAIEPEDQISFASTVAKSKETLTEW